MTKNQVIQELKQKLKLGIKPSDLKNQQAKNSPDEGYESDSSVDIISSKTPLKKDQIKQLQYQIKFESHKAQSYLTELQSTLAELDQAQQTIQSLKNPIKLPKENQSRETKTPPPPPEPKQYLFTCDICQQNKKSLLHRSRVNGLGIDPHQLQKICDYCLKKVDLIQERKEDFF